MNTVMYFWPCCCFDVKVYLMCTCHSEQSSLNLCHSFTFDNIFLGADTVRFKAEINFDGREVARVHVARLDLEKMLKVVCHAARLTITI